MTAGPAENVAHPYVERRPGVHGGRPVIKGSRLPVSTIAREAERGASAEDIAHTYPWLHREEIADALAFARDHREEVDADISQSTDIETAMRAYPPSLRLVSNGGD